MTQQEEHIVHKHNAALKQVRDSFNINPSKDGEQTLKILTDIFGEPWNDKIAEHSIENIKGAIIAAHAAQDGKLPAVPDPIAITHHESPVVVYPSSQPGMLYECEDGTMINFSVTIRQGGTAEMVLDAIAQYIALMHYGLKVNPAAIIGKAHTQTEPASPFSKAQGAQSAPASAPAPDGGADQYGNVPGEVKAHIVEFVSFNEENKKKHIALYVKGLQFPIKVTREDHMKIIADATQGVVDFSNLQYGVKYAVQGKLIRVVASNKNSNGNYYLNFHNFELGNAGQSAADLPF